VRQAFLLFFAILGAVGLTGGAWPLLTGKNYPGLLGRGFTRPDNVRLNRAPTIYFRAMGAVIASAGLAMFSLSFMMGLSADPSAAELVWTAILLSVGLVGLSASIAWLIVVAHRHKLFRWDAP
jgi:hypothetical protein